MSKGPNSHGGKNSNSISMKYRAVHHSMLSRTDVLVCGNSDPGTSGCLSPFVKMDGLYFNADKESSDYFYNLVKELDEKYSKENKTYIMCECDNPKDFYNLLKMLQDFSTDGMSVSCLSRENSYDVVLHKIHDMDDQTKPATVALQKHKIDDVERVIKAEEVRATIKELEEAGEL